MVSGSGNGIAGFCKHKLGNDLIVVTLQQLATREPMGDTEKVHGFGVVSHGTVTHCIVCYIK